MALAGIGRTSAERYSFPNVQSTKAKQETKTGKQRKVTPPKQRAFDAVLKDCSKTENFQDWVGFRCYLRGAAKAERVWELGFVADRRQYRILGIFGDERKHAVLLVGCYHKGSNYTPSNAIETARKRAKGFKEEKGGLRERKIETDF